MIDTKTTAAELHHYFGNHVGIARWSHVGDTYIYNINRCRDAFIAGLEKTLAEELPESAGVTIIHLQEMIKLARGDWSELETIKSLYRYYYNVTGGQFDEAKLFPTE